MLIFHIFSLFFPHTVQNLHLILLKRLVTPWVNERMRIVVVVVISLNAVHTESYEWVSIIALTNWVLDNNA